jgi:hypothetical protein
VACRAAAAAEAGLVEVAGQAGVAHPALKGAGQPSAGQRLASAATRRTPGNSPLAPAMRSWLQPVSAGAQEAKPSVTTAEPAPTWPARKARSRLGLRVGNRDHAGAADAPSAAVARRRRPAPSCLSADRCRYAGGDASDAWTGSALPRSTSGASITDPPVHQPGHRVSGPCGGHVHQQLHQHAVVIGWGTTECRQGSPATTVAGHAAGADVRIASPPATVRSNQTPSSR